jgi:hypothetical protein
MVYTSMVWYTLYLYLLVLLDVGIPWSAIHSGTSCMQVYTSVYTVCGCYTEVYMVSTDVLIPLQSVYTVLLPSLVLHL